MLFMQFLLNGIAIGAIYSLVALGFVLLFKATAVLNFAHGAFLMLAAYLSVTVLVEMDIPFVVGALGIVIFMGFLGILIHYIVMQWMLGKSFFAIVLVTIGMEIVIRALILVIYGPLPRGKLEELPQGQFHLGAITVPYVNALIFAVAALVVGLFLWFFARSELGLHMRAVAENLEAATAVGIKPHRIYASAWAIGLMLAAVGGIFYAHFAPSIGLELSSIGLRAFPAAILGGLDSVGGAILGGLAVGIVESVGSGYIGVEYRDVIAFGIMFAVLLWRPSGLFGTRELIRV